MSAESPRRSQRTVGSVVKPQTVSDKSVMESVVDFIQDVAYSHNTSKADDKEKVQWVKFEQADINDIQRNSNYNPTSGNVAPLLIVLGYSNGVQLWTVAATGDATEVLSMRQGPVRVLRVLPQPFDAHGKSDSYKNKRPLIALCDASSSHQPYCSVKFVSLRTGEEVKTISFNDRVVTDIKCNSRLVVVAFSERIAAFDSCYFREKFTITSCYPSPGINPNPIALATRWLAYADKKLVPVHQSCGGMTGDGAQSYAATVISAAKTITKGLSYFGETVASSLTGSKPGSSSQSKKETAVLDCNGWRPGVVTVIDTQTVNEGLVAVSDAYDGAGLIAHFPAHATEPVTAMNFDPTGTMLLTVDRLGHNFHLFRIMVHPTSCSLGAVHHLYTLHRGDTPAKIQDISFSQDTRWVAVTTLRATSHIFPITPYGGAVNVRTHTSPQVVNRASRFHRSAGLEDISARASSSKDSVSSSPSSSPGHTTDHYRNVLHHNVLNSNMHNPRLPPYPHPTTIYPLAQIKQTMSIPGLGSSGGTAKSSTGQGQSSRISGDVCVASIFGPTRGWVASSPNVSRDRSDEKKATDSLYIIDWTGTLIEHIVEPRVKSGIDKPTEESPLEVATSTRAQWSLARSITSVELRPPLSVTNPLVAASDSVMKQETHESQVASQQASGGWSGQTRRDSSSLEKSSEDNEWLSQVEIITHAGPHRRLWMGPQFSFKTFQGSSMTVISSNPSVLHSQSTETQFSSLDLVSDDLDLHTLRLSHGRSSPMAMPGSGSKRKHRISSGDSDSRSSAPMLIEAGSYEQSPGVLIEPAVGWAGEGPVPGDLGDDDLREHLAEAMHDVAESRRAIHHTDIEGGLSLDNLSTSSGSASSSRHGSHTMDQRRSPPLSADHVLVFPNASGSPDSYN